MIFITETWLQLKHLDELITIQGYSLFRSDRLVQRGGGVLIYLLDDIFSNLKVSVIPSNLPDLESIFLHISSSNFSLLVACIYRCPDSSFQVDGLLFPFLSSLFLQYENIVIAGDFNFPNMIWPFSNIVYSNQSYQLLSDFISHSHAEQLITKPTRYRIGQNPSTLDLVFASDSNLITNIQYMAPLGKSDHVVLKFNIQVIPITQNKKSTRYITYINYDKLNNKLLEINWESELSDDDVEKNWLKFKNILNELEKLYSTFKLESFNPIKPWINSKLFELVKHKKYLWQKYSRTKDELDYQNHRTFSNNLKTNIQQARTAYETTIAESPNSKKFYKYIRRSLNTAVKIPQLKNCDGKPTSTESEAAFIFAESFFKSYAASIYSRTTPVTSSIEQPLSNVEFTESIISKKLSHLKNSSPGPDNISPTLLKKCSNSLSFPLSLLMQKSFLTGKLPSDWKLAYVKPIYKKGDRLDPSNYRPISLTSVVVKVMESVVVDSLTEFFVKNTIIPNVQHGFVKGRSVETNLLSALADWVPELDKHQSIDVVYLDFSKAFDRVPTNLLIEKLEYFGITGALLSWLRDFLTNRIFQVKVGTSLSKFYPVLSGVPQGSVLGPQLFLLYVADIPSHLKSSCLQYADDLKLYVNPAQNGNLLQSDLNFLSDWCEKWRLDLNVSKCVCFASRKKKP